MFYFGKGKIVIDERTAESDVRRDGMEAVPYCKN